MENETLIPAGNTTADDVAAARRIAVDLAHVEHVKGAWAALGCVLWIGGTVLCIYLAGKFRPFRTL